MAPRSRDPFQNFTLPSREMAEDIIVKFCARVGPRSISLVITNSPPSGRSQGHVSDVLIFWQIPIPTTILTCAQKRTSSQLSLPHGTVN